MSAVLERFEKTLQSYSADSRGAAIRTVAKKQPAGFTAWIKAQISGTPYTAEGFDLARGKLEALGFSKAEAMKHTSRWHAAHGLWLVKQNEDHRSREAKKLRQEAPAVAPAVARNAPDSTAHVAGAGAYTAAVARYQSEGLTRGQAIARAAREHPEAHAAWVAEYNTPRSAVTSPPTPGAIPPARPIHQPVQTPPAPPIGVAAQQPAASGTPPSAHQVLNAEELAELRTRWEKFSALRAVYGDDFNLLLACREGRLTFEEVKSLREATASKQSREMWKSWDASQKRVA